MTGLPADIGTMAAFARASAATGTSNGRVFDWDDAARRIVERGIQDAQAGLISDWGSTGGTILAYGRPVPAEDTYTFLASNWATPGLLIDGDVEPCWRYERDTDGWDSKTYWPESALAILRGDAS